jgi:acyl dehydratase
VAAVNDVWQRRFEVDQVTIDSWAELTGDHNPLHVDPTYAGQTRFGGTICHGHYTLALMEAMMHDLAGTLWLNGGLLSDVRFRSPVRPGRDYVLTATREEGEGWVLEVHDEREGTLAASGHARISDAADWG